MEIYQLKVFIAVADRMSFSDAAKALNLTQPAVSTKIKLLERELKTQLFVRTGRGISLTSCGEFLLEEGRKLVDQESKLVQSLENSSQGLASGLTIACPLSIREGWLPDIIYPFRQQHGPSAIKLSIFNSSQDIYQAVEDGKADFGLSALPRQDAAADIITLTVGSIHYALVQAHGNPHLLPTELPSLHDLLQYPWVVFTPAYLSRQVFEARLSELKLSLSDIPHLEEVDSPQLMSQYLTQGGYLGFASDLELLPQNMGDRIQFNPLQEFQLGTGIYLVIRQKQSQEQTSCQITGIDSLRPSHAALRSLAHLKPRTTTLKSFFTTMAEVIPGKGYATQRANSEKANPDQLDGASTRLGQNYAHFDLSRLFFQPSDSRRAQEPITVSIGTIDRSIKDLPAGLLIRKLGLLDHYMPREGKYEGMQVAWHDHQFGKPILDKLNQGQLDIAVLGDYPLLLSGLTTSTYLVSFVAINPKGSGGGIAVPRSSSLDTITDLKGHTVRFIPCTSVYGLILRSLNHAQILEDVELEEHCGLLADALPHHYSEPFALSARKMRVLGENLRLLLDGDLCGLPNFDGIVVRKAFADEHPEVVVAYLRSLVAAQNWYRNSPHAAPAISRWLNLNSSSTSLQILAASTRDKLSNPYYPETRIRTDWVKSHINAFRQISKSREIGTIQLNQWIRPDFLQDAMRLQG